TILRSGLRRAKTPKEEPDRKQISWPGCRMSEHRSGFFTTERNHECSAAELRARAFPLNKLLVTKDFDMQFYSPKRAVWRFFDRKVKMQGALLSSAPIQWPAAFERARVRSRVLTDPEHVRHDFAPMQGLAQRQRE